MIFNWSVQELDILLQGLHFFPWKFINWSLYLGVMSPQKCMIHNLTIFLKIETLFFWILRNFATLSLSFITKYNVGRRMVICPNFRLWWIMWIHVFHDFIHAPLWLQFALINLFMDIDFTLNTHWFQSHPKVPMPFFFVGIREHTMGLHYSTMTITKVLYFLYHLTNLRVCHERRIWK
jgi:hypothetical protein